MTGLSMTPANNFTFTDPGDGGPPVMTATGGQLNMQSTPAMPGASALTQAMARIGKGAKAATPYLQKIQGLLGPQQGQDQGQEQGQQWQRFQGPNMSYIAPPQNQNFFGGGS